MLSGRQKGHHKRRCPKPKSCLAGNAWRQLNKEFIDRVHNLSLQAFLEYKSSAGGGPLWRENDQLTFCALKFRQ